MPTFVPDLTRYEAYTALPLWSFQVNAPVPADLYIREAGQLVLYRSASLPFTVADRDRLLAAGVSDLWLRVAGDERAERQLATAMEFPDTLFPLPAKAKLLSDATLVAARRAFAHPEAEETLIEAGNLVGTAVGYLTGNPDAFGALQGVMHHDFSTYTHSANVMVYALALARFVGVEDPENLKALGLGALLHDVGKTKIPTRILHKPGQLTNEEWRVLRIHPSAGIRMLSGGPMLSETVRAVVAQHHERPDGSGYPTGIGIESMHECATIVGLVDAYDAMTSDRPYRRALTPFNALLQLKRGSGKTVDRELFLKLVCLLAGMSVRGAEATRPFPRTWPSLPSQAADRPFASRREMIAGLLNLGAHQREAFNRLVTPDGGPERAEAVLELLGVPADRGPKLVKLLYAPSGDHGSSPVAVEAPVPAATERSFSGEPSPASYRVSAP